MSRLRANECTNAHNAQAVSGAAQETGSAVATDRLVLRQDKLFCNILDEPEPCMAQRGCASIFTASFHVRKHLVPCRCTSFPPVLSPDCSVTPFCKPTASQTRLVLLQPGLRKSWFCWPSANNGSGASGDHRCIFKSEMCVFVVRSTLDSKRNDRSRRSTSSKR